MLLGRLQGTLTGSSPLAAATTAHAGAATATALLQLRRLMSSQQQQQPSTGTDKQQQQQPSTGTDKQPSTGTDKQPADKPDESKKQEMLAHFAFQQTGHPLDNVAVTAKLNLQRPSKKSYLMYQPAYTEEELLRIKPTHHEPTKMDDRIAQFAVKLVRSCFDMSTGYGFLNFDEKLWLRRIIFLETTAAVPGMVAGMLRHLRSLRLMRRDHGWIHTLLSEAENERMHLLTFLQLKQPGYLFRLFVLGAQGVMFNLYFLMYLVAPSSCHRFVGYLEEEAVKTYTHCLHDLDAGKLKEWAVTPAPEIAINYWQLKENAMVRDVILAVRADEANHRDVNHTFSSLKTDDDNPFKDH